MLYVSLKTVTSFDSDKKINSLIVLVNTPPFLHSYTANNWYDNNYDDDSSFFFSNNTGKQYRVNINSKLYTWVLRDGDIDTVDVTAPTLDGLYKYVFLILLNMWELKSA